MVTTGLAAESQSAGQARHFVANTLGGWGCAHVTDTACLLTSELVTNAIKHGREPLLLSLSHHQAEVRVEVSDGGGGEAKVCDRGPASVSGRGLVLVQAMSAAWGVDLAAGGKAVWFSLPI